jgi:hypothetical protein
VARDGPTRTRNVERVMADSRIATLATRYRLHLAKLRTYIRSLMLAIAEAEMDKHREEVFNKLDHPE